MIGWALTHGPARKALGFILSAATILLFLLNLRRAGERGGRVGERDARERNDAIHRRCSMPPPAVLLIVMLWLTGCAMDGSETRAPCPPVVDYTAKDKARAADEVEALEKDAVIVPMLSDYVVLRD